MARQPIFDPQRKIVAYELLFRSETTHTMPAWIDGNLASSSVMATTLQSMWSREITGGRPVFINATRQLIVGDYFHLLPPEGTVVEILENIEPDEELYAACQRLKRLGYRIALDDVTDLARYELLLDLVDIIKIDFRLTSPAQRRAIVANVRPNTVLLGEKIETPEEFEEALALGCHLFQGYGLGRPNLVRQKKIPSSKMHSLRTLSRAQEPGVQIGELAQVVREDLSLSVQLLRYLNSSIFRWSRPITSVKQGLVLLGLDPARRWVTLTALAGLAGAGPDEPLRRALIRAHHAEALAQTSGARHLQDDAFMLGMLSTLDLLLGVSLETILAQLSLRPNVTDTLLGRDTELAPYLSYVKAYEDADWERCRVLESAIALPSPPHLYRAAVRYCEHVFP